MVLCLLDGAVRAVRCAMGECCADRLRCKVFLIVVDWSLAGLDVKGGRAK